MASQDGSQPAGPAGLRERKKVKTRTAIQRHALRLFQEQGYEATTVEQIAEAAEVSPSTFFRYFPTKEDVVLLDELDPLIIEAFQAQPPATSPIHALRNAMHSVWSAMPPEDEAVQRERAALILSVPRLRAMMLVQFSDLLQEIAQLVANRVGRKPTEFPVRAFAGAVLGVMMSAVLSGAEDPKADYLSLFDAGLEFLESGLQL